MLVQRYRLGGGAKLGTGGLVRAYGGTAAACLAAAEIVEVVPTVPLGVRYPPADVGLVFSALSGYQLREATGGGAASSATSSAASSDEEVPMIEARFDAPHEDVARLERALRDATKGRAILTRVRDDEPPSEEL